LIPENAYFGMDTLLKEMIAQRRTVSRYLIHEYWLDIGLVEDYSQARVAYAEHFGKREAS